jgi:NAD(P)-dependent dehydrogenase (short-subunit alcohol dehydrogenase family)
MGYSSKTLKDSFVLITGALTGIGRATAFAFVEEGAKVVVSGRKDFEGNALADELRALGAEAEFIKADVRHEADVKALVDGAVRRFGRLDIAVNNAGTEGLRGSIIDQTAGLPEARKLCLGCRGAFP